MTPFAYAVADSPGAAIERVAATRGASFIAGGTDMLQLLQDGVAEPSELIDINRLPFAGIDVDDRGATIGALARMADVAGDARIQREFPVVSQALLLSASQQVRNMASIGGNLLQRTRCLYFRDATVPCNKRVPGSGCPARDGANRMNAILGVSEQCIAAYPGDLAVALVALDAETVVSGTGGERRVPVDELHRLPGDTPHIETALAPGDLITAVVIPAAPFARRSVYLKVRDRASFEFAISSAAVGLALDEGVIREARVAVGGVATKPWRLRHVEAALGGQRAGPDVFREAAAHAADGAEPRAQNAFKVELLRRTVARALAMAAESA